MAKQEWSVAINRDYTITKSCVVAVFANSKEEAEELAYDEAFNGDPDWDVGPEEESSECYIVAKRVK